MQRLVSRPGETGGQSIGALQLARAFLSGDVGVPASLSPLAAIDHLLEQGIARSLAHPSFKVRDWLQVEVATSFDAREHTEYGKWQEMTGWDDRGLGESASLCVMFGAACGQNYFPIRAIGDLLQRLHPEGADLLLATMDAVDDLLFPVLTPWRLCLMAVSYLWYDQDTDAAFLMEANPETDNELPEQGPRTARAILEQLGWEGPSFFADDHPVWALPPELRHRLPAQDPGQLALTGESEGNVLKRRSYADYDEVLDACLALAGPPALRALLDRLAALRSVLDIRRRLKLAPDVRTFFPEQGIFLQACNDVRMGHWVDSVYQHQWEGEGVTAYYAELQVKINGARDADRLNGLLRSYVSDLARVAALFEAFVPMLRDDKDSDERT